MKSTTAYLVQLPEPLREMAMLAARETFPRGQLVPVRTVGEALQLPGQGRQLPHLAGLPDIIGHARRRLPTSPQALAR